MRIGIATDHGGYPLKVEIMQRLEKAGHELVDLRDRTRHRRRLSRFRHAAGKSRGRR